MKYTYRMSREMYLETVADAKKCRMSIEKYVTEYSGLFGRCVKVEVV